MKDLTPVTVMRKNMNDASWIIIDTETTGLFDPIYVIEIAAQRMRGWEPDGDPFHAFLNHGVAVPPEATAVNGITTDYIRKHGQVPTDVHLGFAEYVQQSPVIAHNLSYDWNRCLIPEWQRLSMDAAGTKGFCSMLLSRRVLPETKSVKLDTLRELFGIGTEGAHSALGDVAAIVTLAHDVFRPRLENAGLKTFDEIKDFSRATPIKKCHARLKQSDSSELPASENTEPKDEWYCLDEKSAVHGPFPAGHVSELSGNSACYIWREGLADWVSSSDDPWFSKLASRPRREPRQTYKEDKSIAELIGLCRGIMADEKVTNKEVYQLSQWLEDCPFLDTWPASEIAQEVEEILEDGVITREEKLSLAKLIAEITGA